MEKTYILTTNWAFYYEDSSNGEEYHTIWDGYEAGAFDNDTLQIDENILMDDIKKLEKELGNGQFTLLTENQKKVSPSIIDVNFNNGDDVPQYCILIETNISRTELESFLFRHDVLSSQDDGQYFLDLIVEELKEN